MEGEARGERREGREDEGGGRAGRRRKAKFGEARAEGGEARPGDDPKKGRAERKASGGGKGGEQYSNSKPKDSQAGSKKEIEAPWEDQEGGGRKSRDGKSRGKKDWKSGDTKDGWKDRRWKKDKGDDRRDANGSSSQLNGGVVLHMPLEPAPPGVPRYTREELFGIGKLPASQVKPANMHVAIDRENAGSHLVGKEKKDKERRRRSDAADEDDLDEDAHNSGADRASDAAGETTKRAERRRERARERERERERQRAERGALRSGLDGEPGESAADGGGVQGDVAGAASRQQADELDWDVPAVGADGGFDLSAFTLGDIREAEKSISGGMTLSDYKASRRTAAAPAAPESKLEALRETERDAGTAPAADSAPATSSGSTEPRKPAGEPEPPADELAAGFGFAGSLGAGLGDFGDDFGGGSFFADEEDEDVSECASRGFGKWFGSRGRSARSTGSTAASETSPAAADCHPSLPPVSESEAPSAAFAEASAPAPAVSSAASWLDGGLQASQVATSSGSDNSQHAAGDGPPTADAADARSSGTAAAASTQSADSSGKRSAAAAEEGGPRGSASQERRAGSHGETARQEAASAAAKGDSSRSEAATAAPTDSKRTAPDSSKGASKDKSFNVAGRSILSMLARPAGDSVASDKGTNQQNKLSVAELFHLAQGKELPSMPPVQPPRRGDEPDEGDEVEWSHEALASQHAPWAQMTPATFEQLRMQEFAAAAAHESEAHRMGSRLGYAQPSAPYGVPVAPSYSAASVQAAAVAAAAASAAGHSRDGNELFHEAYAQAMLGVRGNGFHGQGGAGMYAGGQGWSAPMFGASQWASGGGRQQYGQAYAQLDPSAQAFALHGASTASAAALTAFDRGEGASSSALPAAPDAAASSAAAKGAGATTAAALAGAKANAGSVVVASPSTAETSEAAATPAAGGSLANLGPSPLGLPAQAAEPGSPSREGGEEESGCSQS